MPLLNFSAERADMFSRFWGLSNLEAALLEIATGNPFVDGIPTRQHIIIGAGLYRLELFGSFNGSTQAAVLNSPVTSLNLRDAFGQMFFNLQDARVTLAGLTALDVLTAPFAGADNIYGTVLGDVLRGFGGNDTINGGGGGDFILGEAGNDIIYGNNANDQLRGGVGDDTYYLFDSAAHVVELAGEGADIIYAYNSSFALPDNVEKLTIEAFQDVNATGNALNNVIAITGTGNNILDGKQGADAMNGGAGDDTYVVDNLLDKVEEKLVGTAGGTDLVQSSVNFTLGANVENLELIGSAINATGNTLANSLTGNDSDNVLLGLAGNDILVGGAGKDILDGGAGNDTLSGGLGDDTYVLDNTADTITELSGLGSGTDTAKIAYNVSVATLITLGTGIFTNVENLTITGTGAFNLTGDGGDNVLTGNASVNTLNGGDGNDTYVLSAGDTIIDSSGIDTISATFSLDLNAFPGIENITLLGTAGISATGDAEVNVLTGNAGANTLDGGVGADTMAGGAGNDIYIVDDNNDTVIELLAGGTDLVKTSADFNLDTNGANVENLTLIAGAGGINGIGNALNNTILGNEGNNILDGKQGADAMNGGAGDDTYVVDNLLDKVEEKLVGTAGGTDLVQSSVNFTLGANVENLELIGSAINATGNTLANSLTGNDSDNVLLGLAGNDILVGGAGKDILDGGAGNDTLSGGLGDDTYVLDNTADTITELSGLGSGTDTAKIAYNVSVATLITLGTGIFTNVENLTITGTGAFNLTGDGGDNVLTGNAGKNVLTGGAGDDTLDGGGGGVIVSASRDDRDILTGGTGDDTYIIRNIATSNIVELSGQGSDTVMVGVSFDVDYFTTLNTVLETPGIVEIENVVLTGTASINAYGNSLNNRLQGNSGNNVLVGGAGNDILDGGAGRDILDGGAGDDTYVVDDPLDLIVEQFNAGNDTVISSRSVDLRIGFLSIENVELAGMATAVTGNDENNNIGGNALANSLAGYGGNDVLQGKAGDDGLDGGDGDDRLEGQEGNDTLDGGRGNDILDGGTGVDTMVGGLGDDTFYFDQVGDSVLELAEEGRDTIVINRDVNLTLEFDNVENATLSGTGDYNATGDDGDNVLTGNTGANVLAGGLGNDTYVIDASGDTVVELANQGIDTVVIGRNVDLGSEFGNVENATLSGIGSFTILGNDLDNVLTGNTAANVITGGAGNDTLDGGGGADELRGGTGDDIYVIRDSQAVVVEIDSEGVDTIHAMFGITDLWANVENVVLVDGGSYANGNALDNVLTGNDGNNSLWGREGFDLLIGGLGNDNYQIDDNNDTIVEFEGEGLDSVTLNRMTSYLLPDNVENLQVAYGAGSGVGLAGATGNSLNNTMTGGQSWDTLDGGAGNDILDGGLGGSDTLYGGLGDDQLTGGFGFDGDTLYGGEGNDLLLGSAGNDSLFGDDGNDSLDGGMGSDSMSGGGGDDSFVFDQNDTSVSGGAGFDTLKGKFQFMDFTQLADGIYTGIEAIDLRDSGPIHSTNTVTLTASDVKALSDTTDELKIFGDSVDRVALHGSWTNLGTTNQDSVAFNTYELDGAKVYVTGAEVLFA